MKENKKEWRRDRDYDRERGGKERNTGKEGERKGRVKHAMTHCAALAFCPPFPSDWEIVRLGGTVLDSQDGK